MSDTVHSTSYNPPSMPTVEDRLSKLEAKTSSASDVESRLAKLEAVKSDGTSSDAEARLVKLEANMHRVMTRLLGVNEAQRSQPAQPTPPKPAVHKPPGKSLP